MQILINTCHNIDGDEALTTWIGKVVEKAFERQSDRITRMGIHPRDEGAGKGGRNDKPCTMEARLAGHWPLVVTHRATVSDLAVKSTADKRVRLIGNALGQLRDPYPRGTESSPLVDIPVAEA